MNRQRPTQRVRFTAFLALAAIAGLAWYAVLSLPISPVSYQFLVEADDWPDPRRAGELAIASAASALLLVRLIRARLRHAVILAGGVYTLVCGTAFGLTTFVSQAIEAAVSDVPLYPELGPNLPFDGLAFAAIGFVYAVVSGHVAIPAGIALVLLYRRVLGVPTAREHSEG